MTAAIWAVVVIPTQANQSTPTQATNRIYKDLLVDMAFKTFVQVGRAVLIVNGPEAGKLGVIGMSNLSRLAYLANISGS